MTRPIRASRRAALRLLSAGTLLSLAACGGLPVVTSDGPRIDTSAPVQVALLVPGGSGQAGDEALAVSLENAARLAMADLQGVQVDLRVYRTGGGAGTAAAVAAQAADEGAKILLGPVYAAEANAAAAAVAPRGINVLAFSNNSDIAGGNLFVLGTTFETIAARLATFAAAQGRRTAVIAYGSDTAERTGRDALAAAIARAGGTVAGEVPFELSQNGVVQAVERVTGTVKASGADSLYFTSGTAGALPILSQLVVENGVSPPVTQFIGLQRWDIPPTAPELPGLQGGWFALPSPTLAAQFESRYAAAYGQPPHPIASLAYDGIAAIGALVSSSNATALSSAALTQPTGFAGVNGAFRFLPDGSNERGLAVATISNKQVTVLDPAPRSFTGAGF